MSLDFWPLILNESCTHAIMKINVRYCDVIMRAMASQITSLTIVYSTVYSGADQRKYQSSASQALLRGIPRWPVNSPHKWPVTRKKGLHLMTSSCIKQTVSNIHTAPNLWMMLAALVWFILRTKTSIFISAAEIIGYLGVQTLDKPFIVMYVW